MKTLKEFEEFVRNRPVPDTPGVYKLTIYKWNKHYPPKDGRYEAIPLTVEDSNDNEVSGFCWRFPFTDDGRNQADYEYHPTFEQAHEAMMGYVGGENIYGFCIDRLGYGPLGNHDWYVAYWSYDATGHEFDHSSCSSYHYNQPGIYGKFLGRFPEEIPFKEGDIVQIVVGLHNNLGKLFYYSTLGVVAGTPRTVKDYWEGYVEYMKNGGDEHKYFEEPDHAGTDEEEYFIMYGPFDDDQHNFTFRGAREVRLPAYPVPDNVRETLMGYYQEYQKYFEDEEKRYNEEHKEYEKDDKQESIK